MRWPGLLTLLFAGPAALLWAADDKKPDEPVRGFLVHEWGVCGVHDDVDLANVDMGTELDALPPFVYGQTTTREFPRHWDEPPTDVLKPVLFFHAARRCKQRCASIFQEACPPSGGPPRSILLTPRYPLCWS